MRLRLTLAPLVLLLAGLGAAQTPQATQAKTEIGELNHAKFRIDIPENWNHGLVVYCHGYSAEPGNVPQKELPKALAVFVKAGYALIQSGYSTGGWAVEQAIPETEALRHYFIDKYGKPKETFLTGHSMGGFITMAMMEKFPESYDAALPLCGPLASSSWFMQRYAFDLRVVFDYYFPGALPPPIKIPADYKMNDDLRKSVKQLLDGKPEYADLLKRLSGTHNNTDMANGLVFGTFVLKDLQQRAGGNPFDNRYTIYTGTPDDNTLNDKVQRYAADPGALNYLERFYTPTGKITRPMLAIHTTYDPLVSPEIPYMYALLTRQTGKSDLFVQQYVKHDGHCNITAEETEQGFAQLREWKDKGTRPMPGKLVAVAPSSVSTVAKEQK
ncbi:MAG TPA: alpha/beta fold hydrolase [Candidatus Angelobacter sp.]|nr:alpha/beta fold hydrolase [Candidatus Angelobacter sp.]